MISNFSSRYEVVLESWRCLRPAQGLTSAAMPIWRDPKPDFRWRHSVALFWVGHGSPAIELLNLGWVSPEGGRSCPGISQSTIRTRHRRVVVVPVVFVAAFSVPYRGSVPSLQRPVGSGFGAATTAAEVLEGIDLTGRLAVVTGGYSGIGLETRGPGRRRRACCRAGPPPRRGAEALAGVDGVEIDELDLGDLDSVAGFAERFLASGRRIDLLIANAGIMACPETRVGPGWEAQFATNHLGHFALVNRLWPAIASVGARVVSVSSLGHRRSRMRWDDVQFEHGYDKWTAYGQAKTANVLFAVHLDSLGEAAGVRAFSLHRAGSSRRCSASAHRGDGRVRVDRRERQPDRLGVPDPRAGRRDDSVGGDVTAARRHRRRVLRGLRHRRTHRRPEHSSGCAELGDRPGRGSPAVGTVVHADRRRRASPVETRLWSVSAGVSRRPVLRSVCGNDDS